MRVIFISLFVLGGALAYRWGDGGHDKGWRDRFGGDQNGDRSRYDDDKDGSRKFRGLFNNVFKKRQATFPSEDVVNNVKLTLGKAYIGISADDLATAAQTEKDAAEALLATNKADVSDEDAQSVINDIAAKVNGIPAVESIDSDELGDQANKITLILQLWKGLAEKIKSLEGSGQNYDAALKAISKLSDSLLKAVQKSVDYVTVKLFRRDLKKKGTKIKRQDGGDGGDGEGGWSTDVIADYSPDAGATVGGTLNYSNGPWTGTGGLQYNTNTGTSGNLGLGYQGDCYKVNGDVGYNPNTGTNGNVGLSYQGNGYQIGGNVGYSPSSGTTLGISGRWEFK